MVQRAQIVDITKSYLPGDPNSFVQNLVNTDREDGEEKTLPLVPYEGYNFLPTSYGYKSYFGTNAVLNIQALPSRCQYLFAYQLPNYQTRFIALCEDGIWVCNGNVAASTWSHEVVFDLVTPPTYDPDVYEEWTACIIENVLYMYQQGRSTAWKTAIVANELDIQTHTPTFLNMSGQMGIFRAGTRLGFWDSANSVSWSSNLDLTDFTPSLENLAGNRIFGAVTGRIVTIKAHGEGFIVYSTKSVVGATFLSTGSLLWDAKKVFDNTGISYSRAVTVGKTDHEHFIFGTSGIYTIGKYNALVGKYEGDAILPEVYDYLKESRDPVYLSILQDRYLCFSVISSDYIYGRQSFYTGVVNPQDVVVDWYLPSEDDPVPTYELLPEQLWEIILTEMNGDRTRSRTDNRKWIPLYTSTYDRMDDRYQAFHTSFMGETVTGLPSYSERNAGLDSPITGSMVTDCQPPLASSRFGEVRTFTEIRATESEFGATLNRTNETLITAQEEEWDEYKRHAIANKDYIESITVVTQTSGGPISGTAPANTDNTVESSLGTFITGSGNTDWLVTKGPAEDAALEVIMRRIFNKAFEVVKHTRTVRTHTQLSGTIYKTSITYCTGTYVNSVYGVWSPSTPAADQTSVGYSLVSQTEAYQAAAAGVGSLSVSYRYNDGVHPEYTSSTRSWTGPLSSIGLYGGYSGSNFTQYSWNGSVISSGPFNNPPSYYYLPSPGVTQTSDTSYYTYTETETVTYTVEEIDQNAGYSECRMTVTHWDLIEPGLYGDYTLIQRVAASAMTPKIWDNHFPDDRQDRDNTWAYSVYTAKKVVDLASGTIDRTPVFSSTDPDASSNPLEIGITSNIPDFTLPGTSFLLQTGSIEAAYPTFTGALIFDLQLKKWGKYRGDHELLIETTPVNANILDTITYTDLGTNAGILNAVGEIRVFDSTPTDSWMRWGKLGYYRLGMTDILEIKASNRIPLNTSIMVDSSMDGKILDMTLSESYYYWNEVICEALPDISARWHTVKISGNYDLTGLEIRAKIAGRR